MWQRMDIPFYWRSQGGNKKEKIIVMDQRVLSYTEDIRKIRMHRPVLVSYFSPTGSHKSS